MPAQKIVDVASAARFLTQAATRALASQDDDVLTERVLRLYRDDARAVVVATLRTLAGGSSGAGIVKTPDAGEFRLSELADAIERREGE